MEAVKAMAQEGNPPQEHLPQEGNPAPQQNLSGIAPPPAPRPPQEETGANNEPGEVSVERGPPTIEQRPVEQEVQPEVLESNLQTNSE